MSMSSGRFIIGIDEAGRGPLAGPVAVGAVAVPMDFNWKAVYSVKDSKRLTPRAREIWFGKLQDLRRAKKLDFSVSFSPAQMIDRRGIVVSIQSALITCLQQIGAKPKNCEIFLDGSLYAPRNFPAQKTIIHGDDIEPIISMASIIAKVSRDGLMRRLAARFPEYSFDMNKGYGTKTHRVSIKKHGLCKLHRKSFCTKFLIGDVGRGNRF